MRGALCGVLSWLLLLATSCTSTVVPPVDVDDPVTIFVLKEALHVGVVLPPDPAAAAHNQPLEYIEFGFGDWQYYALDNSGSSGACTAVLWPTQGALGRRAFGATTPAALRAKAYWTELESFEVDRAKALALRRRLQQLFDATPEDQVAVRPRLGFRFVQHDDSYCILQNCADKAAEWLRELDCEIWWMPIRRSLTVEAASESP